MRKSESSDGSSANYYDLPEGATRLQDLISERNMNAQDGEMFRSIYRKGRASHSDELRDARKVLFYAQEEVKRLEKLHKPIIHELYSGGWTPEAVKQAAFPSELYPESTEARMDVVGQNENTAEHYDQSPDWSKAPEGATHWAPHRGVFHSAWYRKEGEDWECWLYPHDTQWGYTGSGCRDDLIPRPE